MTRSIERPKRDPKNHPVVAFDCETVGDKRRFVHACVMDASGVYHFSTPDALRSHLTDDTYAGHNVFAHNLFYDLTLAFDGFKHGIVPLYHNTRLIRAKYKPEHGNLIKFYDTANFTGRRSLDWMGQVVGLPKFETPPQLLEEKDGTNPWSCIAHQTEYCVQCYCENDTRITYLFARMLQDTANVLGCEIKTTVGATAVDLWKRVYINRSYNVPVGYEQRLGRVAYFGGWTENDAIGKVEHVNGYDVNSLYSYVHTKYPYPDTDKMQYRWQPENVNVIVSHLGVSECTVHVPPTRWPALPVYIENRLYFPTGTLTGTWTHVDLNEAIRQGTQIVSIRQSVYATQTCQPLADYMFSLYDFRQTYQIQRNPFESVIKLMLNALTGKFGQRTDNELYDVHHVDNVDFEKLPVGAKEVSPHLPEYLQVPINIPVEADYINTLWASHMTSYARRELRRWCERAKGIVCYKDTDSIHVVGELPVGAAIGELKPEFENRTMTYLGPKFYYSDDDIEPTISKIRGIPTRLHQEFIDKRHVTSKQPASLGIAARGTVTLGDWFEITKTDCARYPKRKPTGHVAVGGNYWNTLPYSFEELVEQLVDANPPPSGWPYNP